MTKLLVAAGLVGVVGFLGFSINRGIKRRREQHEIWCYSLRNQKIYNSQGREVTTEELAGVGIWVERGTQLKIRHKNIGGLTFTPTGVLDSMGKPIDVNRLSSCGIRLIGNTIHVDTCAPYYIGLEGPLGPAGESGRPVVDSKRSEPVAVADSKEPVVDSIRNIRQMIDLSGSSAEQAYQQCLDSYSPRSRLSIERSLAITVDDSKRSEPVATVDSKRSESVAVVDSKRSIDNVVQAIHQNVDQPSNEVICDAANQPPYRITNLWNTEPYNTKY